MIHRGGPYGGHYHAYIRDDLEDGNWDIVLPDLFQTEPEEVKKEETQKKEEPPQEEVKEVEQQTNNKKSKNKKNK